jgi:hypothetical protein
VSAAAISNATPATRGGLFAPVTLADAPPRLREASARQAINAVLMVVSPGLFRTFGTPLRPRFHGRRPPQCAAGGDGESELRAKPAEGPQRCGLEHRTAHA